MIRDHTNPEAENRFTEAATKAQSRRAAEEIREAAEVQRQAQERVRVGAERAARSPTTTVRQALR